MATEKPSDEIMDRLKKVMSLTDSPSVGEAAAAMNRMKDMLDRHQLTVAEVEEWDLSDNANPNQGPTVGGESHTYAKSRFSPLKKAKQRVMEVISKHNHCRILLLSNGVQFRIVGESINTQASIAMYEWVVRQLELMMVRGWKEYKIERNGDTEDPIVFRGNFIQGAAYTIDIRLKNEEGKDREGSERGEHEKLTAIARIHDQAVDRYVKKEYPNLKYQKATRIKGDRDAYKQGLAAGHGVSLKEQKSIA